jgi:hypothetical protein
LRARDFAARAAAPEYLILEYSVEGKIILTRILVLMVYPRFNTKLRETNTSVTFRNVCMRKYASLHNSQNKKSAEFITLSMRMKIQFNWNLTALCCVTVLKRLIELFLPPLKLVEINKPASLSGGEGVRRVESRIWFFGMKLVYSEFGAHLFSSLFSLDR